MPGATWENVERVLLFAYRTVTFYGTTFQYVSAKKNFCNSLTPLQRSQTSPVTLSSKRLQTSMNPVWAGSRSLAATEEVEFSFYSWRYLDVSVPSVRSFDL